MKKIIFSLAVAILLGTTQLSALTLIHYWNFNAISIPAAEIATADRNLPANVLTPIAADFTLVSPATVIYQVKPGTTGTVSSYWDPSGVVSKAPYTTNQRNGDITGNGLRPRDAWQNMELVLNIPSTGYQNLTIMYDSQRSGSGPGVNTYYYSVDGGANWITKGLSTLTNSAAIPSAGFAVQTITITDANADNNANLKFKIWYSDPTNLAGNNRIDNITVEGTKGSYAGIEQNKINNNEISMTPNTNINGVVNFSELVNAVVYNLQGKRIKTVTNTNTFTTNDFAKGLYVVRINGTVSKKLIVE